MANKISVIIDVTVDRANQALGNFRKSVGEADGAIGKFKAGAASAGDSLKANIMPVAAAAGTALVAFAAKSVQAASTLSESTNAVNVSFGDAADGVLEFGETAAESMGLSKAAFNEAAVGFAAFASNIAGPGGDVADVIGDITTRASDFASVMNLDVTEAADVFRSSLAGETEPIKKFGIDLSAAAVEAYALASGMVKSKSDMTEAIKVQARYGLLMQKTSKFQGDFANTSDGLANSSRIAAARFEDLQASIGQKLLPVVEDATGLLLGLADAIDAVGNNSIVKFGDELGLFNNIFGVTKSLWDKGPGSLIKMATATDDAAESTAGLAGALEQQSIDAALAEAATERYADKARDSANDYIDHAKGMQREAAKTAAANEAATARIEAAWGSLNEELSDRSAYLDIQDALAEVDTAFWTAMDTADKSLAEQEADARNLERAIIDVRGKVNEYAKEIAGLPPEYATDIQALIDEGAFAEVERRLATLEKIRIARITPETYIPGGGRTTSSGTRFHSGGVAGVGNFTNDEIPAVLQKGEMVLTEGQQAAVSNALGGGGGGATIHITVNGADPNTVIAAIRKYVRTNGPITGIT